MAQIANIGKVPVAYVVGGVQYAVPPWNQKTPAVEVPEEHVRFAMEQLGVSGAYAAGPLRVVNVPAGLSLVDAVRRLATGDRTPSPPAEETAPAVMGAATSEEDELARVTRAANEKLRVAHAEIAALTKRLTVLEDRLASPEEDPETLATLRAENDALRIQVAALVDERNERTKTNDARGKIVALRRRAAPDAEESAGQG